MKSLAVLKGKNMILTRGLLANYRGLVWLHIFFFLCLIFFVCEWCQLTLQVPLIRQFAWQTELVWSPHTRCPSQILLLHWKAAHSLLQQVHMYARNAQLGSGWQMQHLQSEKLLRLEGFNGISNNPILSSNGMLYSVNNWTYTRQKLSDNTYTYNQSSDLAVNMRAR